MIYTEKTKLALKLCFEAHKEQEKINAGAHPDGRQIVKKRF